MKHLTKPKHKSEETSKQSEGGPTKKVRILEYFQRIKSEDEKGNPWEPVSPAEIAKHVGCVPRYVYDVAERYGYSDYIGSTKKDSADPCLLYTSPSPRDS